MKIDTAESTEMNTNLVLAKELGSSKPENPKVHTKLLARATSRTALLTEMRLAKLSPEAFAQSLEDQNRDDAVSATTLRNWLKLQNNDLADQTCTLMGIAKPGRPRAMIDAILLWAMPKWATLKKGKLKSLHVDCLEMCAEKGLKAPSYSTFRRYAKECTGDIIERNKLGIKSFYEKHGLGVKHPDGMSNAAWVTDACQLKLWIMDELGKLFRPWIVVFMDRASRMVMGWVICRNDVKTDDAIAALKISMLPKSKRAGVNWWGKPKVIHSDNGSVFTSDLFKANLRRLGIEASYSPPACPNANGRMERFFKTFGEDFVCGLEDSIKGHFVCPGDEVQGTWAMLPAQVDKWMLNYDLHRIHSAHEMTPYNAWNEKLKDLSLIHLDFKRINREIYVEKEFTMTKQGVELLPQQFWTSGALLGLRRRKITVQMPPEGPGDKVMAFFGTKCLGELVRQNGGTAIAKELKDANWNHQSELSGLKQAIITGYAQSNKHLGTPKRSNTNRASGAAPKPRRTRKVAKAAIKRTPITTGDSK